MGLKKFYKDNLYALILAGGTGSRFWPFSRELEPKQFLRIIGKKSLLQDTLVRLRGLVKPSQIYIITHKNHFYELKKQIEIFNVPVENILLEPIGKNTAPAIGLFAQFITEKNPQAIFITLPSDHHIKDVNKFKSTLTRAIKPAKEDFLVTIGIKPNRAATGYGYIKIQHSALRKYFKIERFFEKPTLEKAGRFISNKDYFWNSGIFVWKASVFLEELAKYLPKLSSQLKLIKAKGVSDQIWKRIEPISVDYGIMEHTKKGMLVIADFDWTDLGSWDALTDIFKSDACGNVIKADAIASDCSRVSIYGQGKRLICALGLRDIIIADTPDALLVCKKEKAQEVKNIVNILKSAKRKEHMIHVTEKRPWGTYSILQLGEGFKVKLVEIDPLKRLSLQLHRKRAEHWVVIAGTATVTHGKSIKIVNTNESIYIPKGIKHRLENSGNKPLKIIEVQTGSYLEEDDIERFEDDFIR
jgi:mannose-1-phosphate guanylyltransferase/mannose-6-phosphate isomerase